MEKAYAIQLPACAAKRADVSAGGNDRPESETQLTASTEFAAFSEAPTRKSRDVRISAGTI